MCVKSEIECEGDLYQFSADITQEEVQSEHFGAVAWHTEYVIENIVLSINGLLGLLLSIVHLFSG